MQAFATAPDYTLRKLIGPEVNLSDVFSPELIESCQNMVAEAGDNFFIRAQDQVSEIRLLWKNVHPGIPVTEVLVKIQQRVINIQELASFFGYELVKEICMSITAEDSLFNRKDIMSLKEVKLAEKIIYLLDATCDAKISGQDQTIHKELLKVLGMAQAN